MVFPDKIFMATSSPVALDMSRQIWTSLLLLFPALLVLNVNGDCTLGRMDLMETSTNPNPGLYINIDNRAVCSGQITAWNLCYYNPRPFTHLNNLPISLQIWRFDTGIQNGVRVGVYVETVTIPASPVNYQCITIELNPEDYMDVSAGDFIGVFTNRDGVLPVVGNFGALTGLLFVRSEVTTVNRRSSEVSLLSTNALHVTAEIMQVTMPTTAATTPTDMATTTRRTDIPTTIAATIQTTNMPTTIATQRTDMTTTIATTTQTTATKTTTMTAVPSTDTSTPRTDEGEPQPQTTTRPRSSVGTSDETASAAITTPDVLDSSSGLSIGGVLAIVLSLIVIIVAAVMITIFIFIFKQRRKSKKATYSATNEVFKFQAATTEGRKTVMNTCVVNDGDNTYDVPTTPRWKESSMEDCLAYEGCDTWPINMEVCVAYGLPTVVPEAGLGDSDDNQHQYEVVV